MSQVFPCGSPMTENGQCPLHGAAFGCETYMKKKRESEVVAPEDDEEPSEQEEVKNLYAGEVAKAKEEKARVAEAFKKKKGAE